jgi:hypothetical protein
MSRDLVDALIHWLIPREVTVYKTMRLILEQPRICPILFICRCVFFIAGFPNTDTVPCL